MCCLRLTNVQHNKNRFTRARTIQAVIEVEQPNVHSRKKRILIVQHCFLFFGYQNYKKKSEKKLFEFEKHKKNGFRKDKNFFCIIDVEKIKTLLYNSEFPLYRVEIWFLNLDYSPSSRCLLSTVFTILYIYETETIHASE